MASTRRVKIAEVNGEPWELELPIEDGYPSLRDLHWSASFGVFQAMLSDKPLQRLTLSFGKLGWSDPLPLLGIIAIARGAAEQARKRLDVDLGQAPSDLRRGAFLRFLAEHWFLRALWHPMQPGQLRIILDAKPSETEDQFVELERNLSRSGYLLTYDNALCLRARLFRVPIATELPLSETAKTSAVADCLDEIREHGLPPLFAARPELIDALVYKLRVILHELLENGIEHAFHGLEGGALGTYFGVYGRVRRHVLESERKAKWETARRREKSGCPTLGRFNTANNDDWIELFYFDGGRGLLADVDAWAMSARDSGQQGIADAIGGLKSSSNKLGELSKHFFGTALSRVPRTGRTAITGLQHIGLVLASEHDFARACVAREWVGAVHPWKDNVSPGSVNLAKLDEYRKLPEACGTAWHFCVRVHADDVLLPDYWAMREDILEARLPTVDPKQYDTWTIHDERELSGGVRTTDLKTARLGGTAVWLPGDARKQRIFQWLTALRVQTDVKCWLVADIPAYQAVLIAEVLRYERSRLGFPIVLVTDDWRAAYLPEGDRSRNPFVVAEAKRFLSERSADLFVALRAHDSRLFWDGIPNTPNRQSLADIPFVYERVVEWEGSNGAKVTLDGYLELTQALTSPSRSAVCKRAIARTWHFFYPGTRCEAADALLAGLLPEASIRRERSEVAKTTLVSSVLVTGATAERNRTRGFGGTIHLFQHAHVVPSSPLTVDQDVSQLRRQSPIALEWMPQAPTLFRPPDGKLPYQRIPGTPFIGRGGPKAIPIRRFEPPNDLGDSATAFAASFYGEGPGDMYEHFLRLGILKVGHWRYEGHHDLFTVNLAKAYALERIDQGPLVKWLIEQLGKFRQSGAEVLIYPSHRVTDQIVRDLCGRCPTVLPRHVVPVHFLAQHTQSSIRIPSLTYDRIRDLIQAENTAGRQTAVVVFDDGTITGKVAREMEHLIRNAGASRINTIALISRTGLPLYRKLLMQEKARGRRKYFWRWDVPALGSRRTCPLCRAIEQARTVANSMPEGEPRSRLEEWYQHWESGDVVADWERHGLSPDCLPKPRAMTFGKEWLPDEKRTVLKHTVTHTSSTGLAAMVVEVMRTTTYKAVGLKVADAPWGQEDQSPEGPTEAWDRARLETLTSQVLLFFDDLDKFEIAERLSRILNILFRRAERREIDALAGLTILLADGECAELVFHEASASLHENPISSLDGQLALGHILAAARVDLVEERELSEESPWSVDQVATYRENLAYAWRAFAQRRNDPAGTQRMSMLTLVLLLGDTPNTTHCGFLRRRTVYSEYADVSRLISDLRTLKDALEQTSPLLYQSAKHLQLHPESQTHTLEGFIDALRSVSDLPHVAPERSAVFDQLHNYLFGDQGLASAFQKDFIFSGDDLASYLNLEGRHDEIRAEWEQEIHDKSVENPAIRCRWEAAHGYSFPEIVVDMPHEIGKLTLVAPALVRQVIWESMKNVIHSPEPFARSESSGRTDVLVEVQRDDCEVIVRFKMLARVSGQLPDKKTNGELMLSLLGTTVAHRYSSDGDRCILETEVRMATVSGLGGLGL